MAPIRLISKRRKPSHALLRFDDDIAGTLLKIGVQLRKLRRAFLYTDATHLLRHSKSAFSKAPLPLSSAPSHDSEDPFSEKYLADRYLADLSTLSEKPPRGDSSQVRVCQLHEYKAIARSLAASFADDPVALYFVDTPDTAGWSPARKWALHLALMEVVVYMHLLDGLVTTCGADYGAVALWLPPGRDADSLSTFLRSGLWRLRWGGWWSGSEALPADARDRFFRTFAPLLHDTKRRVLGDARDADSWYLVYLGTRPGARRMGHARALVEQITDRADREGKACYLESSKAMNVDIYRKFGFEWRDRIVLEQDAGRLDVPLEIMVREPVATA